MAKKRTTKGECNIEEAIDSCNKDFPSVYDDFISTKYLAWDYVLGGGLPIPRVLNLTSGWGVGKSFTALCLIESMLSSDPEFTVLYLDVERGLSTTLLTNIFGDDYADKYKTRFIIATPSTYEDAQDLILRFAKTGKLKFVVIDSVTSLISRADIEKLEDGDKTQVGGKASAEGKFCPLFKLYTTAYNFSLMYIAQQRANFGGTSWSGPATKMAGGQSLYHNTDIIIKLSNVKSVINLKGEKIAANIKIQCEKNRLVGNRIAYSYYEYGKGISNGRTIVEFLKFINALSVSVANYYFQYEGFDFGEGPGAPVRVYSAAAGFEFILSKMDSLVTFFTANGKLTEFFDNYKFS